MTQFILRRLLLLVPVLLGILLVTFMLTRLIPGDPCVAMLGEKATPEKCADFKQRFGLNDSLPVQFGRYLLSLAQGDFGSSIAKGRPVTTILLERLPMTLEVTVGAMLFSSLIGVAAGLVAATRRNSGADVATMVGANIGVSMPVFWLGLMLAYVFALTLKGTPFWIPPSGRLSAGLSLEPLAETWGLAELAGPAVVLIPFISNTTTLHALLVGRWDVWRDAVWHLILPCVAVGTIPLAIIARMTRSSLLEVLGQDYIRTARAKGAADRVVIFRHALRNALLPVITVIGLNFGGLLSGAVLTETVFSLPGVGTQMVEAILARDYPVIQGFTVVIAVVFVLVNLVTDLSYTYLDPRVRLS